VHSCAIHRAPTGGAFSACDARCECQSPNSEDTRDDERDPAHPQGCRPVSNHDWPIHIDPQQVEQRHDGENYPSYNTKRFSVHERSSFSKGTLLSIGGRQSGRPLQLPEEDLGYCGRPSTEKDGILRTFRRSFGVPCIRGWPATLEFFPAIMNLEYPLASNINIRVSHAPWKSGKTCAPTQL